MDTTDPPTTDRRTAILVTGMHRSGTSALTRVLSHLGAALPADPIPGPEGEIDYYESRSVVDLNQQILIDAGSWWGGWQIVEPTGKQREALVEAARDVVRNAFNDDAELIVLKDPRTARLLSLWQEALESLGYRCVTVLSLRDPGEVAASIRRRDHLGAQATALSWLAHVLDTVHASRDMPRVVVSLDRLGRDWRAEAVRIGRMLDIEWPRAMDDAVPDIADFLDVARVHRPPLETPETDEVYKILSRWADDHMDQTDHAMLDDWRRRFDIIRSLSSISAHITYTRIMPNDSENSRKFIQSRREHAGYNREAESAWRLHRQLVAERGRARAAVGAVTSDGREQIQRLRNELKAKTDGIHRLRDRLALESERLRLERQRLRESRRNLRLAQSRAKAADGLTHHFVAALEAEARAQLRVTISRRSTRARRAAKRLAASGLFDASAYVSDHPEVAASGLDPAEHVLRYGTASNYLTPFPPDAAKEGDK